MRAKTLYPMLEALTIGQKLKIPTMMFTSLAAIRMKVSRASHKHNRRYVCVARPWGVIVLHIPLEG
jgi:hypothetical protein